MGLRRQAAPGPRCWYTTARRSGSVGWVATTGSQARSSTDVGMWLTADSWTTDTSRSPVGTGSTGEAGSAEGGAEADGAGDALDDGARDGAVATADGVGRLGDAAPSPALAAGIGVGRSEQPATISTSTRTLPRTTSVDRARARS